MCYVYTFLAPFIYIYIYNPGVGDERMNGWMNEWMNEWMSEWMNACMYACTSERVWSTGEYWQVKSDSIKTLFQCHCFQHKSNKNWSGIKPYPSRGRNLLCLTTAYYNVKMFFIHTCVHPHQCFTIGLPHLHNQIKIVSTRTCNV